MRVKYRSTFPSIQGSRELVHSRISRKRKRLISDLDVQLVQTETRRKLKGSSRKVSTGFQIQWITTKCVPGDASLFIDTSNTTSISPSESVYFPRCRSLSLALDDRAWSCGSCEALLRILRNGKADDPPLRQGCVARGGLAQPAKTRCHCR
jgi:hypothetical protein